MKFFAKLLDFLYPRICPICKNLSDRMEHHICSGCLGNLPYIPTHFSRCVRCGLVLSVNSQNDFLCDSCSKSPPYFDHARACLYYKNEVRDLLHTLKYNQGLFLKNDLCELMEAAFYAYYDKDEIDVITAIPQGKIRRITRGYNQAAILASGLAKRIKIPFFEDLILRVKNTSSQTNFSRKAREENLRGAFVVPQKEYVRNRTILLIDDLMTTGSTLQEASRTLRRAGAYRIFCLTLARD